MSGFTNFAVSFSIISILAGCITTYYLAMDAGGPSRSPRLAARRRLRPLRRPGDGRDLLGLPDRRRPLLLGRQAGPPQQAGLGLVRRLVQLPRRGRRHRGHRLRRGGHVDGAAQPRLRRRGVARRRPSSPSSSSSSLHGLLNTFGVNLVKLLSDVSAWWHLAGVAIIVAVLWLVPDQHQTLAWTFTEFGNATGFGAVSASCLRLPRRPAHGAVHLHRLRRLRPRRRGDEERLGRGAQGHRALGVGLDPRRLGAARLGHRGDPGLRRAARHRDGCRPPRSSSTRPGEPRHQSCSSSAPSPSSSAAWRR